MRKALITGITGQDGSYLAELLLDKGYEVHGLVRRVALEDPEHRLERIKHILPHIKLECGTLESYPSLFRAVTKVKPDECYHLAAQSFVSYSFEDEFSTINTNINGTHFLLAAVKTLTPKCRFYFAGSSEMFGMAETVHAAARGENITIIFINNAIYGMTGGQMAPTTLPGMKTTSSPNGRDVETQGYPIRVSEMLATLDGAGYIVRRSLHDPKNIRLAKKAIRTAFEAQVHGLGFSMVELLSTCNTGWGVTPVESLKWLEEHMIPAFPLGDYKIAPSVAALKF